MEYEVNGGVNTITGDIEWLEAHGGVLYVKGKVGTLVHHGGVMYDQRPSSRVEYRTDTMSSEERLKFRRKIQDLQERLDKSEGQRLKLREKLQNMTDQQKAIEPKAESDDVLVQRIVRLRNELDEERKAHRCEVEELTERLEVALEINAKLRAERVTEEPRHRSQRIADEHIDILATMMAMYPYMPTDDIVMEFGVIEPRIRYVAEVFGVMKSKEARAEAREYLRKQNIEMIERRGGDQTKNKKRKNIVVSTLSNGYALTVENKEYLAFNVNELAAAIFYHVLLGREEYVNKNISENLMTAAATWPTAQEAVEGNATLMAEIQEARREARIARIQNNSLNEKMDALNAECKELKAKYIQAKAKADLADKYKQRADTTYDLYNRERKYSSELNKELLRLKRREEAIPRADERKKRKKEK